jgi:hypothetical protein
MPDKKHGFCNGLHMTLECKDTKLYFGRRVEQIIKKHSPKWERRFSSEAETRGYSPHIVRLKKKGIFFFHWEYWCLCEEDFCIG